MMSPLNINLRSRKIALSLILPLLLLLAGILYCLYYGRIGYMPQDSSTVFDGGWRILSGQIPFRDFTLSNAILPVFFQAFFFKIFGVSWFVYCLHAAIFNGLFCVLAFFFLRLMGGSRLLSFFYALLSGVIFYTPFGIPVQDQHAYFFTFLVLFLACGSARVSEPFLKQGIFFLIPILSGAAFLSKQIPTAFGVLLAVAILLFTSRRNLWMLIRTLLAGTLAAVVILVALYYALGIDFELLKVYFFQLPAETGGERIGRIFSGRFMVVKGYMVAHWPLFFPFGLITLLFLAALFVARSRFTVSAATSSGKSTAQGFTKNPLSLMFAVLFLMAGVSFVVVTNYQFEIGLVMFFILVSLFVVHPRFIVFDTKSRWIVLAGRIRKNFFLLLLAELLLLISFVFVGMTSNQGENGVVLMFVSMGLLHIFLLTLFQPDRKHGFSGSRPVLLAVSCILCLASLACAWNFDRQVNATRMVHDIAGAKNDMGNRHDTLPEMLSFLVWKTPENYTGKPGDFQRIIDYFQTHKGNFFLLGDSSVLYALTGRPSVNPILWFHPGQTIPYKTSPLFPAFESRFMQVLRKYHVRYIILESAWTTEDNLYHCPPGSTWSCTNLSHFPALHEQVLKNGRERERFGPFQIIELIESFDNNEAGK